MGESIDLLLAPLPKAEQPGVDFPGPSRSRLSEAIAVPVAEGRLPELHDGGPRLVEELGGST